MNTKTTATQPAPAAKPKATPCSCGGKGGSECTCCQNICFERPNYFCGQLLNDTDLSAGLTYVREKLKLYHRTLDGWGVVCGLRLTCDHDCCGSIRVGDGYAIDDCGNDLVVCQPLPFDVIAALKAKGWLIKEEHDPCKKEEEPPCKIKQCYYVAICYCEEEAEFTTPFKTNCGPGAAACVPTRIKESVRFEILDKLPKTQNVLDEIEERITCCWKVFTDGPLAKTLQQVIDSLQKSDQKELDYADLFCRVKVLFEHYLKRRPHPYDCTFAERLCQLKCAEKDNREAGLSNLHALIRLIRQYALDCMLGEMIFPCPNPPRANCVVLGTVEVEDGKLLRVCNCPRSYVWSFAHFFEVLLAVGLGGEACEGRREGRDRTAEEGGSKREREHRCHCCATFDFDPITFRKLYTDVPKFGSHAAAAPTRAARQVIAALRRAFNFTHPTAFSSKVYEGMSKARAQRLAVDLAGPHKLGGDDLLAFITPETPEDADLLTALLSHGLTRPGEPLVATPAGTQGNETGQVVPRSQLQPPLAPIVELVARLKEAENRANKAEEAMTKLHEHLTSLKSTVDEIKAKQPAPATTPPAPPPTPPAPPGPVEIK
jgi:hypothetical protein